MQLQTRISKRGPAAPGSGWELCATPSLHACPQWDGSWVGREPAGSVWVLPVSAEANRSDCETKLVRGVAVVKDGQVTQRQQGELLRGELEDGVGDGGLVVQLK